MWSHGKGNMNNHATKSSSHKERRLVSWNENFKKVQGITLAIKWIAKASLGNELWIMIRIRIIIWLGIGFM